MEQNELSAREKKIYGQLLNDTEKVRKSHRWRIIGASIGALVIISILTSNYWVNATISHSTSLMIGGQFLGLFGAFLLGWMAFSKPWRLGLMSMTKRGGNPELFASSMNSRFTSCFGIGFIAAGFFVQAG